MVCMSTNGAVAIDGGNWQIFKGMLDVSGARLVLNTTVTKVLRQDDSTYALSFKSQTATRATEDHKDFDAVVIATPLQFSNINIDPLPQRLPDPIPYVNLHVTLLASPHRISPIPFKLPLLKSPPEVILTTLQGSRERPEGNTAPDGFFSISTLMKIENRRYDPPRAEYIYKIFSPKPLNSTQVSFLFGFLDPRVELAKIPEADVSWLYEKSWNSYPYLSPRVTFDEPFLQEGLWYTSGMESFISTMETSSLAGMNVAQLIIDQWKTPATRPAEQEL